MKPVVTFSLVRLLAFAVILAMSYILMPQGWSDWLYILNVVLFALSAAFFFYWRIGKDPARNALGVLMAARPAMLGVAALALMFCIMGMRRISLSLDLIWVFLWAFSAALLSGAISHISAVQKEHRTSNWYKEVDDGLRNLGVAVGGTPCQQSYRALREDFRLSNKITCELAAATESEISSLLAQLEGETSDPDRFEQTAKKMRQLLARRNQQISRQLNDNDDDEDE